MSFSQSESIVYEKLNMDQGVDIDVFDDTLICMDDSFIESICLQVTCICKRPENFEMVACDGKECKVEWFHLACLDLTLDDLPDGSWFCDECRSEGMCIQFLSR